MLTTHLRVAEDNTPTQHVKLPCCGATWRIDRYEYMKATYGICITCEASLVEKEEELVLEKEKDLTNFRFLKVSRYVS